MLKLSTSTINRTYLEEPNGQVLYKAFKNNIFNLHNSLAR